jgi:hypothetical protein
MLSLMILLKKERTAHKKGDGSLIVHGWYPLNCDIEALAK